jgi:hypothetical protein
VKRPKTDALGEIEERKLWEKNPQGPVHDQKQRKLKTMSTKKTSGRIGRPIQPAHSAAAVTKWYPTDWEHIGGDDIAALPADAFSQSRFAEAYQAGYRVNVYVGACGQNYATPGVRTGLLGVARDLQLPIYKVSSTQCADPRDRLRAMNADRYGSYRQTSSGPVNDLGFNAWMLQQILPTREPKAGAPIELQPRTISVVLPHNLSSREFDKRLHAAMENASLNGWLVSPAGTAHCALLGLTPQDLHRSTVYRFGRATRISPADELYIFRPRGDDADRLLAVIEQILFEHVTGIAPAACQSWASPSQHALRRHNQSAGPQTAVA